MCPQLDNLPKSTREMMAMLEDKVVSLLETALLSTKHVFLVTNGSDWWIKQACTKCMPRYVMKKRTR
jgi:hypothetical protein